VEDEFSRGPRQVPYWDLCGLSLFDGQTRPQVYEGDAHRLLQPQPVAAGVQHGVRVVQTIKVPAIIAANKLVMMVELHEPRDHNFS
jgi:hypothetical protein